MGKLLGPFMASVAADRNLKFWSLQIGGWSAYAFITFLSITLMDDNVSWPHLAHIIMSALLGMLITWPMRPLYRWAHGLNAPRLIAVVGVSVIVFSALWNIGRVLVYAWWIGDKPVWDELNHWYFGSLSIFLTWSVIYFGVKSHDQAELEHEKLEQEEKRRERESYKRLQAESQAREAQLKMLRYQLNPHFLFNTLNSIYALVKLGSNYNAQEMIQQLSRFLRHSLEQGEQVHVTLEQELETLQLYLSIEQARFQDRLNVSYDIDPAALNALVPVLILQPSIENSMKYAIAANEDGGTVFVSARLNGNDLELEVTDSGPGKQQVTEPEGRGVGLNNTRERLKNLYNDSYTIETSLGDKGGFSIRIRFPYVAGAESTEGGNLRSALMTA
jgi:sensor histidine kinase YesM